MKIRKIRVIRVLLLCLLCCATLFVSSQQFVNKEITPKWFALTFVCGFAGIAAAFWKVKQPLYLPAKPVFMLFTVFCAAVFLRSCFNSGFKWHLAMLILCLPVLYIVLQQIIALPAKYLFGTLATFAGLLALQGILQYFNILSKTNNFPITGNFDNPAGYTAALAGMLPCVLYFACGFSKTVKYTALSLVAMIVITLALSEARAAILAGGMVILCWLCSKYSIIKLKRSIKTLIISIFIVSLAGFYFMKKDSADGRILIWQNTLNMLVNKPFTGHGEGAFNAKYMLWQAACFDSHPNSRYAALSDNVLHPFNEYLLLAAEQGFVGLLCLISLIILIIRFYRPNPNPAKFTALIGLAALALLSCFSYPFKYPTAWLLALFNIAIICCSVKISSNIKNRFFVAVLCLCSVTLLFTGAVLMRAEMRWNTIARQSLSGKTAEVLPEYGKLYQYLGTNGLFLYNHAAELHEVRKYEKSLEVFSRCTLFYNDMDV
ncbi:MAG: O-antigen ligase family protein, partial [Prevotellaceae bacterium]|nr:O-antigen ligase family protein [Prevotellaceae bacterium]